MRNVVRSPANVTRACLLVSLTLALFAAWAALSAGAPASASSAATAPYLAAVGCPMSHCDQVISGNSGEPAPTGAITSLWHDTTVPGSGSGLGCSSNGTVIACSFASNLFNWTSLKVYSATGAPLWSSILLGASAYASAPMVDPSGGVIAADGSRLVRFTPTGKIAWQTTTPGGTPISPNITDNGAVILATSGGPVSAYDAASGALLTSLTLSATVTYRGATVKGYYDTVNTPAVYGSRIYVATQFRNSATNAVLPFGRLYALDLLRNANGSGTLAVAWSWDFEAPSGGSPTVLANHGIPTVYFDGSGTTPGAATTSPQLFAVTDLGASGTLLWKHALAIDPLAAATPDPRGGVWTFSPFSSSLIRVDQDTGSVLQTIDTDALVGQPGVHVPSSAMTIAGTAQSPVMFVSATPILMQSSYVLAIDLASGHLLWDYRVDQSKGIGGVPFGQYPIVSRADGRPEVVFSTDANGVWALGAQ